MKRTLIAAAVINLSAAPVMAATIYEGNGLTYELAGDWQIQLRREVGNDQELDVEYDDLELKNRITYALDDGLKAVGQLDFSFDKEANDSDSDSGKLEEAYIGIEYANYQVVVGKMDTAADWFGVEGAYELISAEDQFDYLGTTGGDDVIRGTATYGATTLILSAELEAEGEASENGEFFDLYVGTEVAGLALAAAFQTYKATPASESIETWGVSAGYDFGPLALAADYSTSDLADGDADTTNLVASAPLGERTRVALGVVNFDDSRAADDTNEWYANITHKFAKAPNVSVFAEIADSDIDATDVGYLAGMRIKF